MSDMLALVRRAQESGEYAALTDAIPYCKWLGITAVARDGEMLGLQVFAPHQVGNPVLPALHGGTLGALVESTAIFRLLLDAESAVIPKTINLTIVYLRSARLVDTWARASITKQGRRIATVRVDAWQDDPAKPVVTATLNFVIQPFPGDDDDPAGAPEGSGAAERPAG